MSKNEQPLVSVVTPVYNGADFLAECIESVLSQTYQTFEYLIVNNCSTDRTLEIALSYAKRDSRIRVHDNSQFFQVIANHNHAFSLISPAAKYCKVVSGDDFILPDCLRQMVELAEANPSVGIVGSYQQSGKRVRWQGFRYPTPVLPGHQVCLETFLTDQPDFGFGSPTSILYRADLVRNSREFYPNASPHSDTSACYKELQNCDFGFVYQVLSYERTHGETQSSRSAQINRYLSAGLNDLMQYGPAYLSKEEFERLVKESLYNYHRFLAINYFSGSQGEDFWNYHRGRLKELGYPLSRFQLIKAAMLMILHEVMNPEQAIRKFWKRVFPKSADSGVRAVQPTMSHR
jgi:glycosyltransferase involved in cell wall biosynthesis